MANETVPTAPMNRPTNAAKVFARPRKNLLARSVQNLMVLNALEVLNCKRIVYEYMLGYD
jgi:hypothetical protein